MIVNINVTQKHIDDGVCYSRHNCMVAEALDEVVHEDCYIEVAPGGYSIYHKDAEYKDVKQFGLSVYLRILEFDASNKRLSTPFSFQIDIPEQYLKPEVVTAIKESGYNEAVAIVSACESVAALPLELAHVQ